MTRFTRRQFIDDSVLPSNPAHLVWSKEKMRRLRPEFFGLQGLFYSLYVLLGQQLNDKRFIQECIDGGDSRAAVVVSLSPLLVAAYSDELDAVAILRYPDEFVHDYRLQIGSRLLTVNCYAAGGEIHDLFPGPKNTGQWNNILPVIADFISDDINQINELKRGVPDAEWKRCYAMGLQYIQTFPGRWRDGRPFFASMQLHDAQQYDRDLKRAQRNRMTFAGAGAGSLAAVLFCCGFGFQVLAAMRKPVKLARLAIPAAEQFQAPQPPQHPPPAPIDAQRLAERLIDRAFPPERFEPRPAFPEPQEPENVAAPIQSVPDHPPPIESLPPAAAEQNWQPGARAYAQWGALWEEVQVLKVHGNGNVMIRWLKWGPQWDQVVLGATLRIEPPQSGARSFSAGAWDDSPGVEVGPNTPLKVGDRVYVRSFGQWTAATVTGFRSAQLVMVRIDAAQSPSSFGGERAFSRRMLRLPAEAAAPPKRSSQPSAPVARTRTWTDASGKFKIQARFNELRGDVVVLERDDGANVEIALDRLSSADQQYARSQSAAP